MPRRARRCGFSTAASSTARATCWSGCGQWPTTGFDEDRVGLDHLAFRLDSTAELQAAAAHLDELGIAHEPIKDIGTSHILEFRDPDNIAVELIATK